ncbi:hypothetical protein SPSIL_053560 [Sporomusa silvacetica DSM 10669]|uniref:Uncharacterized protein n=1 Tax=Sporomusa silvacetica DSM 10669 TaxID=1123289 RepID=A0ABZ3ITT8_9FIRM|nr:hypothetical protein [Sporomusa silvacetica]OZC19555.1 hypothetical protein SPSIL_19830 [Sporomusa silvacetica DSM 10669]
MANSTNSLWSSLLTVLKGVAISYVAAKATDSSTSWTTYRNQLVSVAATAVLTEAITSLAATTTETTSTTDTTTTTAQ